VPVVVLHPSKDTYILSYNSNNNYGTNTTLQIGVNGTLSNAQGNILIQFDLSSIPQGAIIISAVLELYCYSRYTTNNDAIISAPLNTIKTDWSETEVNWSTRPSVNSENIEPYTGLWTVNAWWKWNVTDLIRKFVSGTQTNYGFEVSRISSGTYKYSGAQFYSSNYTTNPSLRPRLVVEYLNEKYLFQDGTDIKKYVKKINDTVPLMSSGINGNIVISCSSVYNSNYADWKMFNKTLQGAYDAWLTGSGKTVGEWIQVDFGEGNEKKITKYTLTTRNHSSPNPAYGWVIEASNNASSWIQIDSQNNQNTPSWPGNTKKEYTCATPPTVPYRYYRLRITNAGSQSYCGFGEMELLEEEKGWRVVGAAPVTKTMFDQDGMTDLSIIDHVVIQDLTSDNPEILCWTDETGSSVARTIHLVAVPKPQLLLPVEDLTIGEVESMNLATTLSEVGDIKVIISGDSGATWKGKNGTVEISDLTQVKTNGYTPSEFNTLTKQELTYLFPNRKARFAFYLEQTASADVVTINKLTINENVYKFTPDLNSLKVIYDLLKNENPKLYVSRDDGITWKEVQPDTLTRLDDLPEGTRLRVKAVLSNGQELHGLSYSWI